MGLAMGQRLALFRHTLVCERAFMTTRAVIRRIERPNGEGYVDFVRGEDGHYRFVEYKKDSDPGYKPFFWQRFVSGIYDDLGAAERDAQVAFPWLSDSTEN